VLRSDLSDLRRYLIRASASMETLSVAQNRICSACGTAGDEKTVTRGSFLIELFLWCFFLVPGVIYSIWRSSSRLKVCRACGNAQLVPLDSPVGRELAEKYRSAA
jgi:hypothetical protein